MKLLNRAKKFIMSNDGTGGILTKKKVKVNRFGEAISQKKKRQGTAGSGLSAYESNPYAFYQTPQQRQQPRISRKMRVKTPQIGNNGKGRRVAPNMQLVNNSSGEKQARPTTAVGVKTNNDGFAKPAKGRRFLGSAKP